LGEKVDPDDKANAEAALEKVKEAVKGEDVEAIQQATQELAQASMKLGEALYKEQEGGQEESADEPAAEEPDADSAGGEDVVDADFEEVDDDQKDKGA
jgi:molecular chaperone DnaK